MAKPAPRQPWITEASMLLVEERQATLRAAERARARWALASGAQKELEWRGMGRLRARWRAQLPPLRKALRADKAA
eukprot:2440945-Lingulodinium_polyedra.AAC.1